MQKPPGTAVPRRLFFFAIDDTLRTMSTSTPSVPDLQRLIDGSTFTSAYHFEVQEAADGSCTIAVPYRAEFVRPGERLAGLVVIAAADVAMWLAIKTLRGIDDPSVTAQMESTFLHAAREGFLCRATVHDISGRRAFGTADCRSKNGELLAHHAMTYVRPA